VTAKVERQDLDLQRRRERLGQVPVAAAMLAEAVRHDQDGARPGMRPEPGTQGMSVVGREGDIERRRGT